MKPISYLILIFCGIIACKKDKDKKQTGSAGITTGMAYFKNRLAEDSTRQYPLAYTEIYIRKPTESPDSYLEKVKTDAEGKFYIDLAERPLVLYVKTLQKVLPDTTAMFYGEVSLTTPAPAAAGNIVATFDATSQRAFVLNVVDNTGGALPGSIVYLYNSLPLALLNNTSFSVASFTANTSGRITSTAIKTGTYYLNGIKTSDTITYHRLSKMITIPATGVVQDSMLMSRKEAVFTNGFNITVKDSLDGLIPLADIYIFNSQVLAMSNDPKGAIELLHTDKNGVVIHRDLAAGNYYLNATKMADSITYQRLAKHIVMPASGIVTDTIIVLRKRN